MTVKKAVYSSTEFIRMIAPIFNIPSDQRVRSIKIDAECGKGAAKAELVVYASYDKELSIEPECNLDVRTKRYTIEVKEVIE